MLIQETSFRNRVVGSTLQFLAAKGDSRVPTEGTAFKTSALSSLINGDWYHRSLAHLLSQAADYKQCPITEINKAQAFHQKAQCGGPRVSTKCWPADLATHGQIRTSEGGRECAGKHERMRDRRLDYPERKSVPGQTSGSGGGA